MLTDPLQIHIPTAGVDTSILLAPEGDYVFQITSSVFKESSFEEGLMVWEPALASTQPITTPDGKTIPPNTRFYLQYPCDLAERKEPKYPGQWIKSLCKVVDAIFGTTDADRPDVTKDLLDSATGKLVLGHVVIDTDKQRVSRNKVARLKKVG